ncbi:MAG: hypothetical protein CMQ61_00195 [Gammaproteobacteria bacterium]|nr:hypothetical protein [Gammaproteobacteria bacterium]
MLTFFFDTAFFFEAVFFLEVAFFLATVFFATFLTTFFRAPWGVAGDTSSDSLLSLLSSSAMRFLYSLASDTPTKPKAAHVTKLP